MKTLNKSIFIFFALFLLSIETIQCMIITATHSSLPDSQPLLNPRLPINADGSINQKIWWEALTTSIQQYETREKEFLVNIMFQEFLKSQYQQLIQELHILKHNPELTLDEKKVQRQKNIDSSHSKINRYKSLLGKFFTGTISPDEIIYPKSIDLEAIYRGDAKMARIAKKIPKECLDKSIPTLTIPHKVSATNPISPVQRSMNKPVSIPAAQQLQQSENIQSAITNVSALTPKLNEFVAELLDFCRTGFTIIPSSTINF